jgi:hypothetical protein
MNFEAFLKVKAVRHTRYNAIYKKCPELANWEEGDRKIFLKC